MENQLLVKDFTTYLKKKKNYNPLLGGNIGTPILSLKIKKNNFLVIEA